MTEKEQQDERWFDKLFETTGALVWVSLVGVFLGFGIALGWYLFFKLF